MLWFLANLVSKGVFPTSKESIKIVALSGLLVNRIFCFEPETMVAQLENKRGDTIQTRAIIFFM
jgi:hypothetical protein